MRWQRKRELLSHVFVDQAGALCFQPDRSTLDNLFYIDGVLCVLPSDRPVLEDYVRGIDKLDYLLFKNRPKPK